MQRAKIGLDLITLDLKNARSRQRLRLRQQRTQTLEFDAKLNLMSYHIKSLRRTINRIEKLERNERASKREVMRTEAGRNSMVATYGR